jgi:hypothetical protein
LSANFIKKYEAIVKNYGNKFANFDLFFQNYEGLFVFSRLDIVFNVLQKLLDLKIIERGTKFLETGSGDGRVVALASIMNFDTYGIELSNEMKDKSLEHLKELYENKILDSIPNVIQGDFLDNNTYEYLKCKFNEIDVFFNYYTNTEMLISKVENDSKKGSKIVSISLSKRPVKTKMKLIYSNTLPDLNHYLYVYQNL